MGTEGVEIAPEDEACARYIAHLIDGRPYDHFEAIAAIAAEESARKFLRGDRPHYPPEDLLFCLQRDVVDFILRVRRQGRDVEVLPFIP
jgi:2-phosphosulfolactate phosphatase